MPRVKVRKSSKQGKKYQITVEEYQGKPQKTLHIGSAGMSDFTKHKDPERKKKYLARHRVNEDWSDYYTAGFWARWLLWNKKTLKESKEDISRRFGIKFV